MGCTAGKKKIDKVEICAASNCIPMVDDTDEGCTGNITTFLAATTRKRKGRKKSATFWRSLLFQAT